MSTAAGTSAAERQARAPSRYGTIVVVGGGCYGSYYVRQLGRARRASALSYERLFVIDRNAACAVAAALASGSDADMTAAGAEVVVRDWREFFQDFLGRVADDARAEQPRHDAIVPSPLMPHLMYDWIVARARARWPHRIVETRPLDETPRVPWHRTSPDGTQYVSFAEWTCPINCIEPRTCPATRGPRDWSLPPTVRAFVDESRHRGWGIEGPAIFHCTHRAYGVGMIDVADVIAADRDVAALGARGSFEMLIGTMSHCHGALNLLTVGGESTIPSP